MDPALLLPGSLGGPVGPLVKSPMLFDWRARDLSLIARTGQVGVVNRACDAAAFDRAGQLARAVHSQPLWTPVDTNGDGVLDAVALTTEFASSQALNAPDNLMNAAWQLQNTTRAATADGWTTIADSGTLGFSCVFQYTGWASGTRPVATLVVRAGSATSCTLILYNATTGTQIPTTYRKISGTGSVSAGYITGLTRTDPLVLEVLATGAFGAAQSAGPIFYVGTDAGFGQGTVEVRYLGMENAPGGCATSPILSGTRLASSVSFPIAWPRQPFAYYGRWIEKGSAFLSSGSGDRVWELGTTGTGEDCLYGHGGAYILNWGTLVGTSVINLVSGLTTTDSIGRVMEAAVSLDAFGNGCRAFARDGVILSSGPVAVSPPRINEPWAFPYLVIGAAQGTGTAPGSSEHLAHRFGSSTNLPAGLSGDALLTFLRAS